MCKGSFSFQLLYCASKIGITNNKWQNPASYDRKIPRNPIKQKKSLHSKIFAHTLYTHYLFRYVYLYALHFGFPYMRVSLKKCLFYMSV